METEGFAIYDAMMQLKNEVRFLYGYLLHGACLAVFAAHAWVYSEDIFDVFYAREKMVWWCFGEYRSAT